MPFTSNIFDRAREEIDLVSFLSGYGFEFRRYSSSLRSDRCPACGAGHKGSNRLSLRWQGGHWSWFCFACGEGGDVVTAAQHLEGFSRPIEAAKWLLGEDIKDIPRRKIEVKIQYTPPSTEEVVKRNAARLAFIKRLAGWADNKRKEVWDYLTQERKISPDVVKKALARRIIFFLPSPGRLNWLVREEGLIDLLKQGDLLYYKGDTPYVGSFISKRPLLSPFYRKGQGIVGAEFRAVSDMTPKSISLVSSGLWWWQGESMVAVTEGLPDFLSLPSMGWPGCIVGMPGVGQIKQAIPVLKNLSMPVYIGLDNDEAGQKAAAEIAAAVPACKFLAPVSGKDINDSLKAGVKDWRELLVHRQSEVVAAK